MSRVYQMVVGFGLAAILAGCEEPVPVDYVDLARYTGTWYEIASYPQFFQQGCTGTTATYTPTGDTTFEVLNRCYQGSLDGELDEIVGSAYVADTTSNAKLKVSFGAFPADYWILELADNPAPEPYDWALVGSSSKNFLWILSRTPQLSDADLQEALDAAKDQGYDLDKLNWTIQPE